MSKTVLVHSPLQSAIAQACTSEPMRKPEIQTVGTDARMLANTLAAEVVAHAQLDGKVWLRFAWRLINATTDMRAQFVKTLDEMLKDMRRVNAEAGAALGKDGKPDVSKSDTKQASQRVNTAMVNVSCLRTIANAFNGAATIDGLLTHACESMRLKLGECTQDQVGWSVIVEYARTFSTAKAGRKADPFLTKLSKWLDSTGKVDESDAVQLAQWKEVAALVAKLQG